MPALWAEVFLLAAGPSALAQGLCPSDSPLLPPRARGAGGRAPPAPTHVRLGSFQARQGAESSPLRGCGPHQPLDPPSTRNAPQGHCRAPEWKGVKVRAATRSGPDLDALERPQRSGWWSGRSSRPPATWRTDKPPGGASVGVVARRSRAGLWYFWPLDHVKISLTQGLFERSLRSKV